MSDNILLRVDDLPVQQNRVYSTAQEAVDCPKGNVLLVQDEETGIVYNLAFRPELVIYDQNYQNEQGCSRIFQQHLYEAARIVQRHFGKKSILEVGCGKGTFLKILRSMGFKAVGVDPAYEGEEAYVVKEPFSPSLGITGEAIILRHVLEHVPNPLRFLESIAAANDGKGLIYIEVPCLDWICDHKAWFDIFYEHVNYFRLSDFSRMFGRIIESGWCFGGQYLYLYVVADLSTLGLNSAGRAEAEGFSFPDDFFSSIDLAIDEIQHSKGKKHIIWGAASKGVIFVLHLLRRGGVVPEFAIDINPAKQGRFMPATGLPVLAPEEGLPRLSAGDSIFVMNSNYLEEIRRHAGSKFIYHTVDQKTV